MKKNVQPDYCDTAKRTRLVKIAAVIALVGNLVLATAKLITGFLSGSLAVLGDGIDSSTDVAIALMALAVAFVIDRPSDKKHPWGHGRIEYLSAMLISGIIIYAGVTAFIESLKKIISPVVPDYSAASLIIVASAVAVKIVLGRFVKKKGEEVNSESLVNSGKDALMDSVISASTLLAAIIFLTTGLRTEAWLGAVI